MTSPSSNTPVGAAPPTSRNPITNARAMLARFDAENPRTAGRVRQALGGLLIADGLVGLENPLDGRKTRPGIIGSIIGIAFSVVFLAIPLFVLQQVRAERADAVSSSDPFANDPFFAGPGSSSLGDSGPPAFVDWVLYLFIGIAALLLLSALFTVALRLAAIGFGLFLLRSGSQMVATAPATDPASEQHIQQVVATAKEELSLLLAGGPSAGLLGRVTGRSRGAHHDDFGAPDGFGQAGPGRVAGTM